MSKKETTETIYFGNYGNFEVTFEKDPRYVDTDVSFKDSKFVISSEDKTNFLKDLEELINKYFI